MQNYLPREITSFENIASSYEVYFIDLWGVIHNGIKLFDNAIKVLKKLKDQNKKIILISNAPRTNKTVKKFLTNLKFDLDLINLLVTSGDVTRHYIQEHSCLLYTSDAADE